MKGISHMAIGVSDMVRSLPFYRDLLGLEVMLDTEEKIGSGSRHAVYLRWGKDSGFLVLSLITLLSGLTISRNGSRS